MIQLEEAEFERMKSELTSLRLENGKLREQLRQSEMALSTNVNKYINLKSEIESLEHQVKLQQAKYETLDGILNKFLERRQA